MHRRLHKLRRHAPLALAVALLTAVPLTGAAAASPGSARGAAGTPAGGGASVPAAASGSAAASATVRINEVESDGGTPGDWVELVNTGTASVDVSGWIVKDNDDSHAFPIPSGTTMAAHGFLALDVDPVFGLGSADSARLFLPDGATLVDSYSWTSHAKTTYGRCPDGTGAFTTTKAPTKGAANDCSGQSGPPPAEPWPGGSSVADADAADTFGSNLSGLAYEPSGGAAPGVLWAVKNGPSTLYRLEWDGAKWVPDATDGWKAGKSLHYPDGSGDPDTEGVALTSAGPSGGVYVSTERDNDNGGVSRPEVLRVDPAGTATGLDATKEWNLTADLPSVDPNSGLEAISWVPDTYLTSHGFLDEHTGAAYSPSGYPDHGDGLFFVGLEATGTVYAYALDQSGGGYTRVATVASGFPSVMELQFDPGTDHLWAVCDNTCDGRTATLDIGSDGRFAVTHVYDRPGSMDNLNNEGFALAPQAQCVSGEKPVFWSDDSDDDGHALRAGTIDCTVPAPEPALDSAREIAPRTAPAGLGG